MKLPPKERPPEKVILGLTTARTKGKQSKTTRQKTSDKTTRQKQHKIA